MSCHRGTTNRNQRGSSQDRRARKQWLLNTFGDGVTARCKLRLDPQRCLDVLTFETVSPDRIVPACEGGTYRRSNLQPACPPCQSLQGAQLTAARRPA